VACQHEPGLRIGIYDGRHVAHDVSGDFIGEGRDVVPVKLGDLLFEAAGRRRREDALQEAERLFMHRTAKISSSRRLIDAP
jgi:hypothetical protein